MKKLRIGINGMGRIGRAIFRNNIEKKVFDIVAINDINPDPENIAYMLNYDTQYDRLKNQFTVSGGGLLSNDGHRVKIFCAASIAEVAWEDLNVDFVIDSSGIYSNVNDARLLISRGRVNKVFVTHSPDNVDFTLVLGANDEELDVFQHHIISTSNCDATAIAPVLKIINRSFGIANGYITTLHPWLNYQNLLDGSPGSWSVPGEIYHHYALGRSSTESLIPKPTTAVQAACKVLKSENITEEMLGSLSFRTPTPIVGSADMTLWLSCDSSSGEIMDLFASYEQNQKWNTILNNISPLVSSDFKQVDYAAIIDNRWTQVVNKRLLKLVLWYDNEWGYSSQVINQVQYVALKMGLI